MKINSLALVFLICTCICSIRNKTYSQGTVQGIVFDSQTHQPIAFANVVIEDSNTGSVSDINGKFEIKGVKPGFVKLVVSYIGYATKSSQALFVTNNKSSYVEIEMDPSSAQIDEVEIRAPQFVRKDESPLSLQTIGIREIERNPGGNRDISKVIQSLPGVATSPGFRNDIIIRGGSPSENKFYLDGIEIPVINHFQTQGASGGPVGIINVNFIREVDFYSGAFPASRGNALSSVMEFKQIDGNRDAQRLRFTLGSSEAGITADGPISPKTDYIFSVRRSYLKFLFSLFKLPFLPTFTDAQFRIKHRFDKSNEITLVGLAAYDQFELNESVNDDITDTGQLELNNYILGNLPVNTQWNYTTGINYKHYTRHSTTAVVISRNELDNSSEKYLNNNDSDEMNKLLDYNSREKETKFRVEHTVTAGTMKISGGLNSDYVQYSVNGFDNRETPAGPVKVVFSTGLDFFTYGAFLSASRRFFNNRLSVSTGLRADANNYSNDMNRPLEQLSARISTSWSITEKISINANAGNYYQLPAYTILGYSNASGELINRKNNVTYIRADHLVSGIQFNPDLSSKITLEGFYKKYHNYPLSLADSISLANLGSDFGVVGNEAVKSVSKGRAYGLELLLQRRASSGIYGILAATLVRSEFTGSGNEYKPSAWDNKFFLTFTGGITFGKNWEAGLRFRYLAGRPYTPYDTASSAIKSNWDVSGAGINDYSMLNTQRLPAFHQLDIRIDKSWYLKKWALNLYLDIQNLYNFKSRERDILNVRKDSSGNPVTDPNDPSRYLVYFIKEKSGTVLPTIGVIIDF